MESVKHTVERLVQRVTNPAATETKPQQEVEPSELITSVEWHGKEDIRVNHERKRPRVSDPHDAIVRITSTAICGSDLHLYFNEIPGVKPMVSGDVLGHEGMGIVEDVGSNVKDIRRGDRVVISAVIACGECPYCQRREFSCCDVTNPSSQMEKLYGHRCAGLFGYSHLTGGYDGCQAEFVRVPFADVNLLKVPATLKDEQVLFLSDILCTAWHANELAEVKEGDVVCVWGCGPVGLLTQRMAWFRGAKRVIAIDNVPYRLDYARRLGCEVINFGESNPKEKIPQLVQGGPDVCIDCAGYRFPTSFFHKMQRALKLETDALDIISEMIYVVRKAGRIALIGDYFAVGNGFPIGAFMEKGLTMRGGQLFCQKYWKYLLNLIETGRIDPRFVITHTLPLSEAPRAYKMFAHMEEGAIKVILKPDQK